MIHFYSESLWVPFKNHIYSLWMKTYYHKNDSQELVPGAGCKMGEGGQKVQTSSCKINKSWGCNVQHGDYS